MKHFFIIISAALALAACSQKPQEPAIEAPEGYELVWHDEFNEGTTLSADWIHEVKPSGWVNHELQNYVDGEHHGKRVTEISDGTLKIHCFQEGDSIFSGRVYAHRNEGWLYGYFEASIKLPTGLGTWPAFWMMPVKGEGRWPVCGEIDIMEEVGFHPDYVHSTIHCEDYNHVKGTQRGESKLYPGAEGSFHTYACEWTPDQLQFFVDGEVLFTFQNEGNGHSSWPYHYAFYPILNLAFGGDWGGQQGVDYTALPLTMEVDYVRVFQKKP